MGSDKVVNDGGTAFPATLYSRDSMGDMTIRECYSGMTLRQWYAGMALQGIMANAGHYTGPQQIANEALAAADAMIAAESTDTGEGKP